MNPIRTILQGFSSGGAQFCMWLSLATLIFSVYLEKRPHGAARAAAGITAFILLGALLPPDMTQGANPFLATGWYISAYLLNVGVVLLYCRVSVWEAFSCALYGGLTEHLANSAYILLFASRWQVNGVYALISLTVYALIWLSIGRRMAHNGHYSVKGASKLLVCAFSIFVIVVLSYLCKRTADPTGQMNFESPSARRLLQLVQLYAMSFSGIMLLVEYLHQRHLYTQQELAASHELLRLHEEQYHLTRDNIDLINRKCHDMKHQVTLLMEQSGGFEELRKRYGHEIIKTIEIYDSNIDTGNEVLNTILMDKSLYCSMHDITWTCMAHGEALSFMETMDLVSLLGNALDNAVEAVERMEDKKRQIIDVQILPKGGFVQFLIENSFDGTIHRQGDRLITSKPDKANHGLGVSSIRAIVEKYGGGMSVSAEDGSFVLNIMIPIPNTN